jgi:hypothetical protein
VALLARDDEEQRPIASATCSASLAAGVRTVLA